MGRQSSNISQETNFAAWLNRYLDETDADLTALAAKADISQGYLSMLRHGRRNRPSRKVVEALAAAFGVPLEEALKAAGLSIRARSAVPRTARTQSEIRAVTTEVGALADWSCRIESGKVTLQAEVQQVGEGIFQVRLKLTPSDQRVESMRGCHVRWLTSGQEQVAVIAPAEGVTFTLRSGEHEFHCQWEGEEAVVLKIPVGVSRTAEPSSTKQGPSE